MKISLALPIASTKTFEALFMVCIRFSRSFPKARGDKRWNERSVSDDPILCSVHLRDCYARKKRPGAQATAGN